MKKALIVVSCFLLVFAAYLGYNAVSPNASAAYAKTYSGTFYVAGEGGHFAKAKFKINPANTADPITVEGESRIVIGDHASHPVHDPRIDSNNSNVMFWSTYNVDKTVPGGKTVHVGETDLATGKVIKDLKVKLDPSVTWSGAVYCASGQSKNDYIDVTMTNPSYIDIRSKKTLKLLHRVFLKDLGYNDNYLFFHGTNSPDFKTFEVAITRTKKWKSPSEAPFNGRTGHVDLYLLDLPSLLKGKVKVLAKNTVEAGTGGTGPTGSGTFAFRQNFTPDGKYILQSGADRMYVLDAHTLKVVHMKMMKDGENHDDLPTPDGKYAVMTLRMPGKLMDGALQLYDISTNKIIGKPVSVCNACHTKWVGHAINAPLCGIAPHWQ